jgi:Cu(I)/Ag(I) efflux system membrane fusion protein/cobalt-zinc-cadmium efflux system membrane fusion protein
MGRGMQFLAVGMFFLLGAGLASFVLLNPWDIPFLPGAGVEEEAPAASVPAAPRTLHQCPMHPEVLEEQPGSCPICGMPLQPVDGATGGTEHVEHAGGSGDREVLYWYAPMDPTYMREEPGLSPMGMPLVPRYADEAEASGSGVVRIDPVQVQNIGLVSVAAERRDLHRHIRTVGILDFDAERVSWVNVKFSGWIEKVHVNYVGQEVRAGDPLFEIYSPELVTTQEEYLRAVDYVGSLSGSPRPEARRQAEDLLHATRERLTYWDISEEQIQALEAQRVVQRRLTVLSPGSGVVAEVAREALEGMFVEPGMNLYKVADLSSVWAHADIYEQDMPWVYAGQRAEVRLPYEPDRRYESQVLFLYPEVSQETRTVKICVEIPNRQGNLRPGMYADVILDGRTVTGAVTVPRSAILRSGERNLIFVDLGKGRFAPREVSLGVTGEGDRVQIVSGVEPGEAVVVQAQFMLDSESRVQEAIAKFLDRTRAAGGEQP